MTKYEQEILDDEEDDGTMPANVAELADSVVGHRIVSAGIIEVPHTWRADMTETAFAITLDNGVRVQLRHTDDCCAYTDLKDFFLHPERVDHIITGVGTTDGYTKWHIYADLGDILELTVDWFAGNPFYYGYGFDISVVPLEAAK